MKKFLSILIATAFLFAAALPAAANHGHHRNDGSAVVVGTVLGFVAGVITGGVLNQQGSHYTGNVGYATKPYPDLPAAPAGWVYKAPYVQSGGRCGKLGFVMINGGAEYICRPL